MHANAENSRLAAAAATSRKAQQQNEVEVLVDLYPFIRKYKDGRVERFVSSPFVPADEHGRVATRDIVVDQGSGVSVRLFLPSGAGAAVDSGTGEACRTRLPLVVYFHGGSFCSESAFSRTYNRYASSLASNAGALVVSVEYRLAPEFPIPAAYDDAWTAFQWVQMQLQQVPSSLSFSADPWIADYADPTRTFLAGDSAGGNIAYHTAVRCCHHHHNLEIEGLIMVQPYFWGSDGRLPSETDDPVPAGSLFMPAYGVDRLWPFVTNGMAGNDDPRINPPVDEILSLSLTCRRVLMAVAEKDTLRDRGLRLAERMAPLTDMAVVKSEGEEHGFHLYNPLRATSKKLMKSIVQFIGNVVDDDNDDPCATTKKPSPAPLAVAPSLVLGAPTRPFKDVFGYGMAMKRWTPPDARPNHIITALRVATPHETGSPYP
ncbi:hypothetical protein BRADI_1g50705v3 [Brachypodium distachyon]|uniref:Alpha/beta hydrolase fold-3 domain-containing protein n=1 Tax=Brachypodium distachyon TaxID=15368 RepID=A0A0Q3JQ14_BRADI|nr:hypothetical protein BRADI_1g50705v3 [Brachypodium distachyon]